MLVLVSCGDMDRLECLTISIMAVSLSKILIAHVYVPVKDSILFGLTLLMIDMCC